MDTEEIVLEYGDWWEDMNHRLVEWKYNKWDGPHGEIREAMIQVRDPVSMALWSHIEFHAIGVE